MNFNYFLINTLCLCLHLCLAFPNGAPLKSCEDMIPRHGVDPSENGPYYLEVEKSSGSSYRVTIKSNSIESKIKGFLLEARESAKNGDSTFGKWKVNSADHKEISCFEKASSAVTHARKLQESSVSFEWTPAESDNQKSVTFIATVVRKYHEFYTNIVAVQSLTNKGIQRDTDFDDEQDMEDEDSQNDDEIKATTKTIMPLKNEMSLENPANKENISGVLSIVRESEEKKNNVMLGNQIKSEEKEAPQTSKTLDVLRKSNENMNSVMTLKNEKNQTLNDVKIYAVLPESVPITLIVLNAQPIHRN